jgi:hypothetical protein
MRIVKTFESFRNQHDDHEMMPHQAPKPGMEQYPAAKIDHDDHHEAENYMFFGNLETIQRLTEIMLKMDPLKVDEILKNGHSWAVDHVATSKDDIEEVANFLIGEMNEVSENAEEDTDHSKKDTTSNTEASKGRIIHNGRFMNAPGNEEYMATEGKYTCNECGTAYEAAMINEGDVCECGGTLNKE